MAGALERLIGQKGNRHTGKWVSVCILLLIFFMLIIQLPHIGGLTLQMRTYFEYGFLRRALIGGCIVALCAALLGVILVLKHYSMIGDGLSHVGFGALTIAVALGTVSIDSLPTLLPEGFRLAIVKVCESISNAPIPFTMALVVLCATVLLSGGRDRRAAGDASIALLSTGALAVGVIVSSTVSGMNIDVTNYMFGSILAMGESDVWVSVVLSLIVLLAFFLFYPRIFAVTFDEAFAASTGVRIGRYNRMIAILTAITVVVGMRIMGTMLISSLMILPALTSMHLFSRFRAVMICSAFISVLCFCAGLMLSCLYALPTGAGIVLVNLFAYLIFWCISNLRK